MKMNDVTGPRVRLVGLRALFVGALAGACAACSSSNNDTPGATGGGTTGTGSDAGSGSTGTGDAASGGSTGSGDAGAVTYWQDVEPLFETHCFQCHQQGGIAPFRLDDPVTAQSQATAIRADTQGRVMPPWSIESDGNCGAFSGSLALTDAEIATIASWVDGGAALGTPGVAHVPALPTLPDATEISTPLFAPVVQGGDLAQYDEYRCFLLDAPKAGFITGYDVAPGTPEIVHHVLAFVVDPSAPSALPGKTNLDVMQDLHAQTPDRDGWSCFGMAGDNVNVKAVPVVWAPGQGLVEYPNQSGVPVAATDKVVIQVHYNLADMSNYGKTDQTTVRLRFADSVPNIGVFALHDPFLGSLDSGHPDTLAPVMPSVKYTWKTTVADLGLGGIPGLQLYGIMPHMHQLGHRYNLSLIGGSSGSTCAANVDNWNFHWQRMYFYSNPYAMNDTSELQVTCDYDTTSRTDAVLPGWGTRNEMCLATLYFTFPQPTQ
jgi:hypothetical protein